VTGAFEFVLALDPIRGAAQVGAFGVNDENAFRVSYDPDLVVLLETGVHTVSEIRRLADFDMSFLSAFASVVGVALSFMVSSNHRVELKIDPANQWKAVRTSCV
jgi:hypothetical protein